VAVGVDVILFFEDGVEAAAKYGSHTEKSGRGEEGGNTGIKLFTSQTQR
jgi:hypothetical protein